MPSHRPAVHRSRPYLPRAAADLDACGIGFVADAHGRSSRAIVAAALEGLACVKHRGAAAADGKTADGAGLLVPIPAAIFGDGNGVASLFVRGEDPRAAMEVAAKEEGIEVLDWREVPTDDAFLGSQALAAKPRLVQAVLGRPGSGGRRQRRRAAGVPPQAPGGGHDRGCLRGLVLVPHRGLQGARRRRRRRWLLPRPGRRALRRPLRRVPPALQHQHGTDVGAGPAVPDAVPQRRDQRHRRQRKPHAGAGRARHRGRWPRPREAVPAPARPHRLRLGQTRRRRRAAHPGRARHPPRRGHARPRGVGERPGARRRGARLLPLPLRPRGAVGRTCGHHLHRRAGCGRRPRPQRAAPAALHRVRRRSRHGVLRGGRHRRVGPRQGQAGPPRPRGDALRRPVPRRAVRRGAEAAHRLRPLRPLGGGRLRRHQPGRAGGGHPRRRRARAPPGHPRLHQGGPGHGPQADGGRRPRTGVLDGRRLAPPPPRRSPPPPPPLPAPALRPGHQPPHRPRPGTPGDEPAHAARSPPAHPRRGPRRRPPAHHPLVLLVPLGGGHPLRRGRLPVPGHPARRHLCAGRRSPPGSGRRWPACATRQRRRWRVGPVW